MTDMYSPKTWGNVNVKTTYAWNAAKMVLILVLNSAGTYCTLIKECVVGGMRIFFVQDFLHLTFSSLAFFLTWHCCIIILTFPQNIILCFHTAIPQDIELKLNVYKIYVHSIVFRFQGNVKDPQNLCYWRNLIKK